MTGTLGGKTAFYRVASPSVLDFDDDVVLLETTGLEVTLFGSFPNQMSILTLHDADPEPNMVRDQAIATQIGAVLSMAAGRKIRVASSEITSRMEGKAVTNFLPAALDDREMIGALPDDVQPAFDHLLSQIVGLPEGLRQAVGSAIELHYAAAQLFDVDVNTAHTLTVAGIETLSAQFEQLDIGWDDFEEAKRFETVFASLNLDEVQKEGMREAVLEGKHLKLRQRFATYVGRRLPATFWDHDIIGYTAGLTMNPDGSAAFTGFTKSEGTPIDNVVPKDPEMLRKRLLATYDSRSKYVHTGARAHDTVTTMNALTGRPAQAKTPIAFAGMRRILVALIKAELDEHSIPAALPQFRLFKDLPPDKQVPRQQSDTSNS